MQLAVAGDLDDHGIRQGVHHRSAHTVETARGLIGLARKLAARVEGAEDDLQSGFVGELGVRINRDAAPVVGDGDGVIRMQRHLDPVGVACDGLVH